VTIILCSFTSFSQAPTKTAIANGRWGNAGTWSPNGVPTATDNVLIPNGRSVNIRSNAACNSLTVGAGTAATLQFRGNTAQTLSVTTNILINANGVLNIRLTSNTTHSLFINGDIVNNGKLDLAVDNNSFCNTVFAKNGSQTVSGTGTLCRFHLMQINLGAVITNTLDITASNFTAANGFLTITNGTFKLSTPTAVNISCFSVAATIPTTGGLFLNSATAALSASASVTMNGNITIANGTLNIGNAADQDLISNAGTLNISNGVLNIAGKYNTTGTASTFSISGGTINVPVSGSTNIFLAPFNMSIPGSSFNMSGGIINIIREGGLLGLQHLGFTNTGGTLGTVTGGTLQIGTAATPAGQIMRINSANSIGNLNVSSANATASLVTNPLNIVKNVLISSGILNANNLNITLGGNWTNNGGTYTPGTNTTVFNSATAQSIFKAGGETFNNITFSGAGVKTFSSAIIANANVIVNSGANVDVNSPSNQLSIKGNYTNNGSINTRTGTILFNGAAAQTIGGTSVTNFHNLTINNTSTGVSLLSAQNLINTLTLNNGNFSTNSQSLTMISTATMTARIAQITGTGDITGNVTVQRFAPGGATGWAFFGTPISSALTLNDWNDDIFISCPTCPDGSAGGFLSIYHYDETVAGSYSAAASYIPLNTINDPIIPNKGYWVYLGTGSVTTTDIIVDVTGTVRKFNNTIPINYTNYGSPFDDGWNLIHNPYPSPIRWSLLKGATANIDNAIYVYNADLNAGTGAYATYVNNISSPAVGSGGVGDTIPMSQGFYVHSTGATALNATESNKVGGNPTYLRIAPNIQSAASIAPLLRINLTNGASFYDETVLYFEPGATDYFDAGFDAYKLGGDPSAPSISLVKGHDFQINGINPISGNFTMPLKTVTGYSGTFTISAGNLNSFPSGACISLYDKFTNTTTDLKTNNYIFTLADTTTVARFDLNITLNPLNINSTTNQPSCSLPNAGQITAVGVNAGPWNYYWKNSVGTIIKTSLAKSTTDTLSNLSGSNYTVEVNTVGMCDNNTTGFTLNAVVVPVAAFTSEDTTDINISGLVNFVNTSTNSASDYWDFGDAVGFSTANSPVYNYASTGIFTVTLISTSSTGCNDTTKKQIVVTNNLAIGIQTHENSNGLVVRTMDENDYLIQQKLNGTTDLNFKLYDVSGRVVIDYGDMKSDKINLSVDLKDYNQGLYFLKILANNQLTTIKLPVK
ncbi:MAG TPA: T9SS type A sorting domain-containing protein, partial [Bacteroidia bacterium]|nr:T9SS type A sorting domain-containing protein [Bacteroidia bacterium]